MKNLENLTFTSVFWMSVMPYKDGFTLAQEIREKDQNVPIIFLTAKALKEDVLKGYKVGADDYLNKPF